MSPVMSSDRKSPDRLSALTGLRFLAAVWVVMLHNVNPAKVPRVAVNFIGRGYVAVDLFFVLSGYILTLNYINPAGTFRGGKTKFWMARFARIYPVYALALLLSIGMGLEAYRSAHLFTGRLQFYTSFILTAVLQQSWWNSTATLWNFPAWSVSVEAFFYVVFPIAALWVGRIPARRLFAALGVCWLIAMTGPLLGFIENPAASYDAWRTDFVRYLLMVNPLLRLPEFLFGMMLGRIFQLSGDRFPRLSLWTTVSLVAAAGVLFTTGVPRIFVGNGPLAPVWAVLIYALSTGKPSFLHRILSLPPMVVLGEASYGIYILQAPLAWFVFHYYRGPGRLAVYLAVLIASSLLSFWWFETPVRNAIRTKFGKRPVTVAVARPASESTPVMGPLEPEAG